MKTLMPDRRQASADWHDPCDSSSERKGSDPMMTSTPARPERPAEEPSKGGFTGDQQRYLEGFFAGIQARGVTFAGIATAPDPHPGGPRPLESAADDITKEERIKREAHPLDAIEQLVLDARSNAAPDAENVFRHKWNGLFWLTPVKNAYMCRLRIPGGLIRSRQLREVAAIARELTTGYIQITTRSNLQIRLIEPRNCPEVLRRVQACGLHSRGAGADNIRNITASPTAGIDPHEIFDVRPLVSELAQLIISSREFYDLPRKFNVAFDGGGLISAVEDTNDIGITAVTIRENTVGIDPGVWFRIALGGVTGHQTFARDWGVIVRPEELNRVILGIVRVFIRDGDRTNRRKARLKYLIESRGLDGFRADVEALLGAKLTRLTEDSPLQVKRSFTQQGHGHVGVFPQKQNGRHYIGAGVPVGQLTARQLDRIADLADNYGSGEVRLTVWQNFLVPDIPTAYVTTVARALSRLGFSSTPSHLRSGFVACTGNRFCKYSSTDTKGHAIAMMDFLDRRVSLDRAINIHFTGCPHSCAQHFMGDIGLLGAKVKTGPSGEGYHICVGGGFGENRAIGRQIFTGVPVESLGPTLEAMLKSFLARRANDESFHDFCRRHSVGELQEMFSNGAG
jgi:ferredoxin-nitrite reductase